MVPLQVVTPDVGSHTGNKSQLNRSIGSDSGNYCPTLSSIGTGTSTSATAVNGNFKRKFDAVAISGGPTAKGGKNKKAKTTIMVASIKSFFTPK
jgi:hypothetical protein